MAIAPTAGENPGKDRVRMPPIVQNRVRCASAPTTSPRPAPRSKRAHEARPFRDARNSAGKRSDASAAATSRPERPALQRALRVRSLERESLFSASAPAPMPTIKPRSPTTAFRSPPPLGAASEAGSPETSARRPSPPCPEGPRERRGAAPGPDSSGTGKGTRPHHAHDLRPYGLDRRRGMQAQRTGDVAQNARGAKAHVRGLPTRQDERREAERHARQDHRQVLFIRSLPYAIYMVGPLF